MAQIQILQVFILILNKLTEKHKRIAERMGQKMVWYTYIK